MVAHIHPLTIRTAQSIPYFSNRIPAGFPSPADDYLEKTLDLNEHLIEHPSATFFVKVTGDSMTGAGIFSGDTLIVDRSLKAKTNMIVLAILKGEFTVKRLAQRGGRVYLCAANPSFKQIEVRPEDDFEVWGVVVHVIHSFKK